MSSKPIAGQTWNLLEYQAKGVEFSTMLGTFLWPGKKQQPPDPPPSSPEMSLHFWSLKEPDTQAPHKEDEAYYVIAGRGTLTIEGRPHALKAGDLIFVPRGTHHRFIDFEEEGLVLLVIFAPNFSG